MHYFIDGYNLLFRTFHSSVELQKQRDLLVSDLSNKALQLHLDMTLVFDSHHAPGEATKSHLGSLEIIYTAEGESADIFIVNGLMRVREVNQEMVVTSDKALADNARRMGAKSMSIESFLTWVDARCRNQHKPRKEITSALKDPSQVHLPAPSQSQEERYLEIFEKRYHELKSKSAKLKKERDGHTTN